MLENLELAFFWGASVAYLVSWLFFLAGWKQSAAARLRLGTLALLAGFVLHTGLVGLRWYRAGHVPFLSAFEFVTFFAFLVALVFLLFARREQNRISTVCSNRIQMGPSIFFPREDDSVVIPPEELVLCNDLAGDTARSFVGSQNNSDFTWLHVCPWSSDPMT